MSNYFYWQGQTRIPNFSNMYSAVKLLNAGEYYYNTLPDLSYTRRKEDWCEGGLCPFHSDRNAGSFRVNVANGAFKCFACGAKGGDIISFEMQRHSLGFKEAVEKIAKEWRLA